MENYMMSISLQIKDYTLEMTPMPLQWIFLAFINGQTSSLEINMERRTFKLVDVNIDYISHVSKECKLAAFLALWLCFFIMP